MTIWYRFMVEIGFTQFEWLINSMIKITENIKYKPENSPKWGRMLGIYTYYMGAFVKEYE